MNTIITILCGVAFVCIPLGCQAQADGWKLVWHDEFDIEGAPDPTVWHFEKGFVRNHEDQWYQEDNAYCHGGLLVLEGRAEKRPNPMWQEDSRDWRSRRDSIRYTSSSINTRGT